jgi:hypothetical protein
MVTVGIRTEVSDEHWKNAESPMLVARGTLIEVSEEQPWNVSGSIAKTRGISTEASAVQD